LECVSGTLFVTFSLSTFSTCNEINEKILYFWARIAAKMSRYLKSSVISSVIPFDKSGVTFCGNFVLNNPVLDQLVANVVGDEQYSRVGWREDGNSEIIEKTLVLKCNLLM